MKCKDQEIERLNLLLADAQLGRTNMFGSVNSRGW